MIKLIICAASGELLNTDGRDFSDGVAAGFSDICVSGPHASFIATIDSVSADRLLMVFGVNH